ncbi:MAG TPA: hypothetical protein IAA78_00540 [Candidatus Avamphibacillus intestinigallinarum]|nr:hypothetical protein [Candidatus Avamphibacillus intestinigallinarum]
MRSLNRDELNIASRFLYLSMAITVIKKDLTEVQNGSFKIKEPYLILLEKMLYLAAIERKELRINMRKQSIKVYLLNKNESFSTYLFTAGNREEKRFYFNPAIRKQVVPILNELMTKAAVQVQDSASSN